MMLYNDACNWSATVLLSRSTRRFKLKIESIFDLVLHLDFCDEFLCDVLCFCGLTAKLKLINNIPVNVCEYLIQ